MATVTWTNLTRGWDGEAVALFNGTTLSIVEKTVSDNNFYVQVWLNHTDSKGNMEAIYVIAGHDNLPQSYEASSLYVGQCKY